MVSLKKSVSVKKVKNKGYGNLFGSEINGNGNILGSGNVIINPPIRNTNDITYQYETKGRPIKRRTVKKVNRISLLLTIIGLISDLIGVGTFLYSFLNRKIVMINSTINNIFLLTLFITLASILLFMLTKDMLNGKQLAWIKLFGLYELIYKSVNEDSIYRIIIQGLCPKCGGNVSVHEYKYGQENQINRKEGICSDNPAAHRFTFDHTTFTGELIKE